MVEVSILKDYEFLGVSKLGHARESTDNERVSDR